MGKTVRHLKDDRQKNFIRIFDRACQRHNRWTVWSDFVVMAAISISNLVDKSNAERREASYKAMASKYNEREMECFSEMLAETVIGIDECPDQDFLGEMFMSLELGNDHNGQFFTPYNVCRMMAQMTCWPDLERRIEENGWVSVNDPACGAGALLVAFANECRRPGNDINYQTSVLFVAQDIDLIVACMCYLQLSLLGCPGYVVVGDTIVNPSVSVDGRGLIPVHGENIWYTPMYFRDIWHWRRLWYGVDTLARKTTERAAPERKPEPGPAELKENKLGQLTLF